MADKKGTKKDKIPTVAEKNFCFLKTAVSLMEHNQVNTLLVDMDALKNISEDVNIPEQLRMIFITRNPERFEEMEGENKILLPEADMTQSSEINTALLLSVVNGLVKSDEQVLCLFGHKKRREESETDGEGAEKMLNVIKFFDKAILAPISNALSIKSGVVKPEVWQKVFKLAIAYASEGKEGNPFGAIFVIGDTENVLKFSQDLLPDISVKPRSILATGMKEMLRRYSSMDGATIISGSGKLRAVAQDLKASLSDDKKLPQGLGTRHSHAAAITEVADCFAIALSQSSGTVTVFYKGEIVLQVKKASPPAVATAKS